MSVAGAMELRTSLDAAFGVDLPATAVFDYPTVRALTQLIAQLKQESSGYPIATESGTASDQHGFNTTVATSGPAFHSVVNAINRLVQRVLGAGDAVDSEQPLMEAGLDSLSKCAFCIFRQIAATGNA